MCFVMTKAFWKPPHYLINQMSKVSVRSVFTFEVIWACWSGDVIARIFPAKFCVG